MEEPSNRELHRLLEEVRDDVKEVKIQAKMTNGRVGSLENEKYFMRGGLAVVTVVLLPVILLVIKMLIDN